MGKSNGKFSGAGAIGKQYRRRSYTGGSGRDDYRPVACTRSKR